MQLSQGKYDNRSTSGSQYFQKRFGQSLRQSKDVNVFQNTYSKSPSFFGSQVSKVASQYEVFKPSNSGNQNFKIEVSSPKTRINPFLSSNYNKNCTNLQDKTYQRSSSQNKAFISNLINPNQDNEQKRRRITTYWKMFQTLEESSSQQMGLNSRSSFKENPYFNKLPTQKNTQKERFVQPVTQRNYSPAPKQFASNIKLKLKKSSKQPQDQYHRYLEHIHCTISHQNSITQTFRKFASQQKQKINQRFSQILKEIENTLKQIQTKFQTRVDAHYQQLLKQMANLKNMAEVIWKSKSQENNNQLNLHGSRYRNLKLSQRNIPFTQIQRNGSRPVSSSKYTYEKLSNPYMRSPSSNNLLLNQLKKQDVQIQEYKNTKNFYFKQNSQNPANKAQMLKQMYLVSTKISETMKQAENLFYDQVDLSKHQRQRLFSWFNQKQLSSYKNESQKPVQNISCWETAQISQICNLFDTFRSNLKYKYLQQQSTHQFQLRS